MRPIHRRHLLPAALWKDVADPLAFIVQVGFATILVLAIQTWAMLLLGTTWDNVVEVALFTGVLVATTTRLASRLSRQH